MGGSLLTSRGICPDCHENLPHPGNCRPPWGPNDRYGPTRVGFFSVPLPGPEPDPPAPLAPVVALPEPSEPVEAVAA